MSIERFRQDLKDVAYPGASFAVGGSGTDIWLQVHMIVPDNDNPSGPATLQKGRKWRLSTHMTKSEVVQTAFKAVLTWLEHEARERFCYRGQRIFGPHFDVNDLAELSHWARLDKREHA